MSGIIVEVVEKDGFEDGLWTIRCDGKMAVAIAGAMYDRGLLVERVIDAARSGGFEDYIDMATPEEHRRLADAITDMMGDA